MTERARVNATTIGGKRWYELPNGESVPSVTTFLDVLPKPALHKWKLTKTAEWAYDYQSSWTGLPREAAVTVIKNSVDYDSSARDAGDIAHRILEERAKGKARDEIVIPPGFEPASDVWDAFTSEFDVEILAIEPQLINYSLGYSGSADLIARINGQMSLLDYKSGNGLYGSTAYQLTAYGMSEKIIIKGEEHDMPVIDRTYGLWVRPEGYALYPMEFSDDTFTVVRAARVLFDLTRQDWKYRGKPVNDSPIRKAFSQWGETPVSEE